MTAAKKMTAYGAVVVAALVMGFALLTSASAAPSTSDQSITVDNGAGAKTIPLTATDNVGQLALGTNGTFSIVTAPANGTATVSNAGVLNVFANSAGDTAAATTLTVGANETANFPDSGYLFIDAGDNVDDSTLGSFTLDAGDEVVKYTGKTSSTFTGVTRGAAPETPAGVVIAAGTDIYPIAFSSVAVAPAAGADGSVNLLDASGFITPPTAGTANIVFLGGTDEANTYAGKTGNALTGLVTAAAATGPTNAHAVGESVIQFGMQVDTGSISYDPTAGFVGADSIVVAYTEVAANRTVSIDVISDLPVADDVTANVTATLPVALPTILNFSGSDSSAFAAAGPADVINFTSLPQKGLLTSTSPTLTCTNVTGAVIGEVMTNCSAATVYTPLLGATGVDTFTYTITNGNDGDISAAATVTVTIGGSTTPTPGAGFAKDPLDAGFNITAYNGGTVAEFAADAAAAGASTVFFTIDGAFVGYVVGAPAFVNQAVTDAFASGIPAGEGVIIVASS